MKTVVATVAVLLGAAGFASAQDDRDRKMDELRREFDRTMKGLQQKFDAERERLEREFKAQRDRLLEKKGERREEERKPRSTEDLLQRILDRLDHLERRHDLELPRFDFKKMPFEFKRPDRDFDFKDFKEFAPYWRELVPKFKDEFRFEFKKKGGEDDDDDRRKDKKEKKDRKDEDRKKY